MPKPVAKWLLPLLMAVAAGATEHTPPPVEPASHFAAHETHADEKVTVAVDPYGTEEKCKLFRVDFLGHNVLPVRLIVTNDSDHTVSLREARILLETATGERIQAAEPEDVERLMTLKERQGKRIPLPNGLPSIKLKPKASLKMIEEDFDTFEYSTILVEPHSTHAGFLFYDVSGLSDPLAGTKLLLRKARTAAGDELFYFEIPLRK